jgi:ribose transport system permease protein
MSATSDAPARPTGVTRHTVMASAGALSFALGFVAMIVVFSLAKPDAFLRLATAEVVLRSVAISLPIAIGLTIPLILGDFDLSIAAVAGAAGGLAVALISRWEASWPVAVVVALLLAAGLGFTNGVVVGVLGMSAFIVTLAMSSVAMGLEYLFTGQNQLILPFDSAYVTLGQGSVLGISTPYVVTGLLVVAAWVLTRHIESGRRMYAIGSNVRAAELAGIGVARLRVAGLTLAAVGAAVTGILITARGAGYTPNFATGYLLPSFGAAFLGTTVFRSGQFTVVGTTAGLIFLETLSVGMLTLNLPTWALNAAQGIVLALAVILSRYLRELR